VNIHELTRSECLELLRRTPVARLACARNSQPYVVPVSLYFNDEDTSLYGFSTVGQKIVWMRDNPHVCVEFDEIVDRLHWTSVIVTGMYEELRHAPDTARIQERAMKIFQGQPSWWLPGSATLPRETAHDHPVVYRIRLVSMSGRRTSRPPAEGGALEPESSTLD
jgi:nitroimidazol reductase NimA-like FMN-containing flavoprotein (pyridoxamine 5'-phosphate oxidase superfamily)